MNQFKNYRKPALQKFRPYILGEDLTGITVSEKDKPELGGMIAKSESDESDQWYVSKDFFESNYELADQDQSSDEMSFGAAVELAKRGHKVARKGWNGSGMYAVIMPGFPDGCPANEVTAAMHGIPVGTMLSVRPYWALKTAQDDIAMWAPSGSDSLADDWVLVE